MLDKLLEAIKSPQRSTALDQIGWDCMPDDTHEPDGEEFIYDEEAR